MPKQFEPVSLHASRRGHGIQKWANDVVPTGADQVLTDATMYFDITEGEQVHITRMSLSTNCDGNVVTDASHFNMVSCDAVAAGGTATDLCGHVVVSQASSNRGQILKEWIFDPPIRVTYTSGARSVSMLVNSGPVTGLFTGTWQGWYDREI